ncbi:PP2C family protein-serine/threonine phosphatase [Nocardioides sp.]|uniref:PP2C family protein-serine/threonine phosphatase n=1 Tax=Nocardioides sp. TaxID=35761 RepID=UPI0026038190|nr:GAF domain-containing SpoIIE family protein phosphatase [Nocardioides sp.]
MDELTSEYPIADGSPHQGLPPEVNDPRRLAAVAATGLLDTAPEPAFDALAQLAALATGCDRAFVTFVDGDRSFWKACVGVESGSARQNPVHESFCYFLVGLAGAPFIVSDAASDARTRNHPSVAPMRIGAWAGFPVLDANGHVLGSMCVIDTKPRDWTDSEMAAIRTIAAAVSNEVQLRQSLAATQEALACVSELATNLQENLLPPVLASIPYLQTAASYIPAATGFRVVGDFYDLFQLRDGSWGAVMGDVCGKGVEAAKVASFVRYTLRAEARHDVLPSRVLASLNAAMMDEPEQDRFLTAAFATFRASPRGVTGHLCTAGHPPALISRADAQIEAVGGPGQLLGVLPEVSLHDVPFELSPGDSLLLYTDGVTEAHPPRCQPGQARSLFGEDGLRHAYATCKGLSASDAVATLNEAISRHSDEQLADDTAMLLLRVPDPETR